MWHLRASILRVHMARTVNHSVLPVDARNGGRLVIIAVTVHILFLLISSLFTERGAIVSSHEVGLFKVGPARLSNLQLIAPTPNGHQRPPLRNHKHKAAARDANLHHAEAPRTLQKPLLVPAKSSINVSAYRGFVYPPTRDDWIHVAEIV